MQTAVTPVGNRLVSVRADGQPIKKNDATHLSSFTQFIEEHRNNACCEIPASVLFDAVGAARKIPYGKDTDYPFKASESHPALKLISKWWNENSPNVEYRRASFCYFWVRVEDDDQYWPGQNECPTHEILNFAGLKDSIVTGDNYNQTRCQLLDRL